MKEASADDYVPDVDDIDDIADGEQEFVDLHTAMTMSHPVAGDDQFKSNKSPSERKDAKGEDTPVKSGTTGDTKFAQFRDKIGKTPTRKGDKSQGDMRAETVKEEVELDEKLKYEGKFKKGDTIKAFDFERKKDHYISGKITGTEVRNGAKVYVIKVTNDSGKTSGGRVGDTGYVPMETSMDYDGRIVKEGVELDEAVKAGTMKLKDGKSIKISKDEAKMFDKVLKELNPENRKRMETEMMKNQESYKAMLTFAKRTA